MIRMAVIENRGERGSESQCSATMPCALYCCFSSTYSSSNHTLSIDVMAFVKNNDFSIISLALGCGDKEIIMWNCEKSRPSWQPKENLVVSTAGVWQPKKGDYVPPCSMVIINLR